MTPHRPGNFLSSADPRVPLGGLAAGTADFSDERVLPQ
jgi:hypothetical protein